MQDFDKYTFKYNSGGVEPLKVEIECCGETMDEILDGFKLFLAACTFQPGTINRITYDSPYDVDYDSSGKRYSSIDDVTEDFDTERQTKIELDALGLISTKHTKLLDDVTDSINILDTRLDDQFMEVREDITDTAAGLDITNQVIHNTVQLNVVLSDKVDRMHEAHILACDKISDMENRIKELLALYHITVHEMETLRKGLNK